MRVAFITRSSLFSSAGGDTLQVLNTANYLGKLNVTVEIKMTHEKINYNEYDLIHFFSIIRPADILGHVKKLSQPFVITPLLIDYSEFDKQYRKGISGKIFRFVSADRIEYLKTIARWLRGREHLTSFAFLARGQRHSIQKILREAAMVLPNSQTEYEFLTDRYGIKKHYVEVPNGVESKLFTNSWKCEKDTQMVLCVARIEGLKNQINLIRALNNTEYQLYIIGKPAVNQKTYYNECQRIAAKNIHFIGHLTQEELVPYYEKAKIHILPSWFETCGLASLEAAAMDCAIVITHKGYAAEYFQDYAFYCDPSSPASIKQAVDAASASVTSKIFQQKISSEYTWQNAAIKTHEAYKKILSS